MDKGEVLVSCILYPTPSHVDGEASTNKWISPKLENVLVRIFITEGNYLQGGGGDTTDTYKCWVVRAARGFGPLSLDAVKIGEKIVEKTA
ncbi:unnamed protein product [Sphenostylis stenocarpa]|uniref:Uncharacterized protein n=1 Tax=Sphenostylis stenocarpa TaxID=92480 RepID=A0AA86SQV4_9FABA|nr:unnamed protein product [Sphenostylis stenocarpa]